MIQKLVPPLKRTYLSKTYIRNGNIIEGEKNIFNDNLSTNSYSKSRAVWKRVSDYVQSETKTKNNIQSIIEDNTHVQPE